MKRVIAALAAAFLLGPGTRESVQAQTAITVLSPNGGEILRKGDTLHARWSSSGIDSLSWVQVRIRDSRYSSELESGTWVIANCPNTGHYDWVIPESAGMFSMGHINGSAYTIEISSWSSYVWDTSDSMFSIFDGRAHFSAPSLVCGGGQFVAFTNTTNSVDSNSLIYSWAFPGGGTSSLKNPVAYLGVGLDTVSLSVFDGVTGVYTTETKAIRVDTIPARIYGMTSPFMDSMGTWWTGTEIVGLDSIDLCAVHHPVLGVDLGGSYAATIKWNWYAADTLMSMAYPITSGEYKVSVTDDAGCVLRDSVYLNLSCLSSHQTIANFSAPDTICSGSPLHVTNLSVSSELRTNLRFYWLYERDSTGFMVSSPYEVDGLAPVEWLSPGTWSIQLIISDSNGYFLSEHTDTTIILEAPLLGSTNWWQMLPCSGDSVTITMWSTVPGSTVEWVSADNSTIFAASTDTLSINAGIGSYYFWTVAPNGCHLAYGTTAPAYVNPGPYYNLFIYGLYPSEYHSYTFSEFSGVDTFVVCQSYNASLFSFHNYSWVDTFSNQDSNYRYLWSNGDTTRIGHVRGTGLYNITVTAPNGCTANKSCYIIVDSVHSYGPAQFTQSTDTVCIGSHVIFTPLSHYTSYLDSIGVSLSWGWSAPAVTFNWTEDDGFDMVFYTSGYYTVFHETNVREGGITTYHMDSVHVFVVPYSIIEGLSTTANLQCGDSVQISLTISDSPVNVIWNTPTGVIDTVNSNNFTVHDTGAYSISAIITSQGCLTPFDPSVMKVNVLPRIVTFDTSIYTTLAFVGLDSIPVLSTPYTYLDSTLTSDSKVYWHYIHTTYFSVIDSVQKTYINYNVLSCGVGYSFWRDSVISMLPAGGYTSSTDSSWNDTVTCMSNLFLPITSRDSVSDISTGTSVSVHIDSVLYEQGYYRTTDSMWVNPHIVDSFHVLSFSHLAINNCTGDSLIVIDSTKSVLLGTGDVYVLIWHLYVTDTVRCANDTVSIPGSVSVWIDSTLTGMCLSPYAVIDSIYSSGGVYNLIVRRDSITLLYYEVDSFRSYSLSTCVRNVCSGDTLSSSLNHITNNILLYNATHTMVRLSVSDTFWCHHDTVNVSHTSWNIDTFAYTYQPYSYRDSIAFTGGFVISGDSGLAKVYTVDTLYLDTTFYRIFNACTLDTSMVVNTVNPHYTGEIYALDSGVHHYYRDTTFVATGITKVNLMEIKVFPNPCNQSIIVQAPGKFTVTICDVWGQEVSSGFGTDEFVLDIKFLAAAMYMVTVRNESGLTQTRRIVKQ